MARIYKIVTTDAWAQALEKAAFFGAAIDLTDGYIHFSNASQVEETARRHFPGQDNLLLVAFDSAHFGESLRWEASRGGALFPHLYGILKPALALWTKPLPWTADGHRFPEGWRA